VLRIPHLGTMLLLGCTCCSEQSTLSESDLRTARRLTEEYQAALKNALTQAMAKGGPMAAIQVCNTEAPEIGRRVTHEYPNWTVQRTALRTRNVENRPDAEQNRGLAQLQKLITQGQPPDKVEWHQIQNDRFIYMRPIMTGAMCVVCHGDPAALPPDVKQAIEQLYPQDEAVGFSPGDLRGAFVVAGPLAK
jgi:hypothetical protein